MRQRTSRILVVDDEPDMARSVVRTLERARHQVSVCHSGEKALELAAADPPDLVVSDLRMPGMDGLELLAELRARHSGVSVVLLTGHSSVDSAVEAIKKGATDYLTKPFAPEELLLRVEKALSWVQLTEENRYLREAASSPGHARIVGNSPALHEVLRLVDKVAPTDSRVMVVGESGTGKELVARTIHQRSSRSTLPFFAVNCGALSEGLLESELFGHERGAFTGAVGTKKGIFEVTNGGTLFLDEVSETSTALQTKLLRVVQEGEFVRVGGTRTLGSDVRLISSTNRDPRTCVAEGKLREDLFYRLAVVQLQLPPLRERGSDVAQLAAHFVDLYAQRIKKRVGDVAPEALTALMSYDWPGNVRELENVIERAIIMVEDGQPIRLHDLPADVAQQQPRPHQLRDRVREAERETIILALRECDWNRTLAAKKLGIGRRTLYDRLSRHGISLKPEL